MRLRTCLSSVVVIAAILLVTAQVSAAVLTWDGDPAAEGLQDGGGTWDTGSFDRWYNPETFGYQSWNNLTPDSAVFGNADGAAAVVTLGEAITADSITFNAAGSGAYTVNGGTLTLAGTRTITANADATIGSILAGTQGMVKSGAGTLVLTGVSNYTGTTTVDGGTLQMGYGPQGWIAPGTFSLQNGANLAFYRDQDITYNHAITGDGNLILKGGVDGAVYRLNVPQTYAGSTLLSGRGYLVCNVNNTLPASTVLTIQPVGGIFRYDLGWLKSQTIAGLVSARDDNAVVYSDNLGGLTINVAEGSSYTFGGRLGSTGSLGFTLTKAGPGTQILTGANTYNGLTTVNAGTLQIGNGENIASLGASSFNVAAGATLAFNRNIDATDFTTQSISGAGDVVFRGQQTGYFRFLNSYTGTLNHTGRTIVNLDDAPGNGYWQGVIWLEKDNLLSANSVLQMEGGKLYLVNQTGTGIRTAGLIGNEGTYITTREGAVQKFTVNVAEGQKYTFAGVIGTDNGGGANDNLTVTKTGPGTQVLAGVNTYSGATTVNGGTLLVNGSLNSFGTVAVNTGGTLGGTGFVGTVAFGAGALLSPGDGGVGTFFTAGATFAPGSLLDWELNNEFEHDRLATGALTINGGTINLYQTGTTEPFSANGEYVLMNYTSFFSGSTANLFVNNPVAGKSYLFDAADGSVTLTIADLVTAKIWRSDAASGAWSSAANWQPSAVPVNGDTLTFAGNSHAGDNTNDLTNLAVEGITFAADAGAFVISGNKIRLGGNIINSSAEAQTFNVPMTLTGDRTILGGAQGVALAGAIDDGGLGYGLAVPLGQATLSGLNTFSGTLAVGGTVVASSAANLGTGALVLNSGTLAFAGAFDPSKTADDFPRLVTLADGLNTLAVGDHDITVANPIDGFGGLVKTGAGALTLAADNTFAGGTTVNAGILRIGNGGDTGAVTGNIVNNGAVEVNRIGTVVLGAISGTGSLKQAGPGTLVLTGASTYTGGTTVNVGATLQLGDGGTIGLVPGPIVNDGELVYNVNAFTHLPNAVSGSGNVTFRNNGGFWYSFQPPLNPLTYTGTTTIDVVNNDPNSYDGALFIQQGGGLPAGTVVNMLSGKLILRQNQTIGGLTGDGGTILKDLGYGGNYLLTINVASEGETYTSGTLIQNGIHAEAVVGLTKSGPGTQVLTNTNTYTGPTTINGGVLSLAGFGGSAANSAMNVRGGTLRLDDTEGDNANRVSDTAPITLRGSIEFIGNGAGPTVENVGTLTFFGGGIAASRADASGTPVLAFSGVTERPDHATLNVQTADAEVRIPFAGLTNGIIGPWITANDSFAVLGANNSLVPYATYPGGDVNLGALASDPMAHVKPAGAQTDVTTPKTFYSLNLAGSTGVAMSGSGALVLASGGLILNTTGAISGGTLTGSEEGDLIIHALQDATINSQIVDNGLASSLVKAGGGVLTLSAANSFRGDTLINRGILRLGNAAALQFSTLDTSGAGALSFGDLAAATILSLKGNGNLALANENAEPVALSVRGGAAPFAGALSGPGSLVKNGSGTLVLTGTNTHTGGTSVNGGTLQIGDGGNTGALTGDVILKNNSTLTYHYGPGNAADITYNGNIRGEGHLVLGGGVLRLGGTNTYTGATTINQGWLVTNTSDALPQGTLVQFGATAGTAALDITGNQIAVSGLSSAPQPAYAIDIYTRLTTTGAITIDVAEGQSHTYGGTLGLGAGNRAFAVVKEGPGTQVLAGDTWHTQGTLVNAGMLQIGNNNASVNVGNGNYSVAAGATLVFSRNADNSLFINQSISGDGDVVFRGQQNGYFTFRQDYTGTLSHAGRTIVNLNDTADNTWWQGALWLEKDDLLPHATVLELQSGKVITRAQTGNGLTIAGLAGSAGTFITTDEAGQKWTIAVPEGQSPVFAGTLGADGTGVGNNNLILTKSGPGTQVLSGDNTYTGGTTINAGTLQIGDGGATGSIAGNVTTNGVLAFNRSNEYLFFGAISGSGSVLQAGEGTLSLWSANSHSGGTTVEAGRLVLANNEALGTGGLTVKAGQVDLAGYVPTVASLSGEAAGSIVNSSMLFSTTLTVDQAAGSSRYDGSLVGGEGLGSLGLLKQGEGTLILGGTNTYADGTTVSGGVLEITSSSALPAGGALTIGASGTVVLGSGLSAGNAVVASQSAVPVPEPSAVALLVAGLAVAFAAWLRKWSRKTSA